MEIDFNIGLENALDQSRQITAELRLQANELQKVVQYQRAASSAAQIRGIPSNLKLQPPGVRPPSSNPPPGIPQIAPFGRTGALTAAGRAGIEDPNEMRIFNARFDRAIEKLQQSAKARGYGSDVIPDKFGGRSVKGLLGGLRSLSRGALSAQGLRSFTSDAAALGLASGSPLGGVAGAGFGRVAGAIGAPVLAGVAGAKTILDLAAGAWRSGMEIGNVLDKPGRAIKSIFQKELRGLPGSQAVTNALANAKFGDKPVMTRNAIGDFFHYWNKDSIGAQLFQYEDTWATAMRDARRKEKLANDLRRNVAERPDLMAAYLSDLFGGKHVTNANTQSILHAVFHGLETGQLTAGQVEAMNAAVRIGQDRADKVTVPQKRDEREVKARTDALDRIMAMQKQEWNPS